MPAPTFATANAEGKVATFLAAVEDGDTRAAATGRAGIPRRTLYGWLDRGDDALKKEDRGGELNEEERAYAEFRTEYEAALDLGEANLMDKACELAEKGDPNWKWYAQILERTRRETWGYKSQVELAGGDAVQLIIEGRPQRQLREAGSESNGNGRVIDLPQRAIPPSTEA